MSFTHLFLSFLFACLPDLQDASKQRHLLRLWLAPPEERPLPEAYREIMAGGLKAGDRGGIVAEQTLNVPLQPHA